ncbi:MAG: hypothetical protein ACR2RB_06985 [Gammaproteobacteria bacterium]
MNSSDRYSDEYLNAFIDGELAEAESICVLKAINESHELRDRVARMRMLNDMVRHAYGRPPKARVGRAQMREPRRPAFTSSLAAGLALMAGFAIGWLANVHFDDASPADIRPMTLSAHADESVSPGATGDGISARRIVLHLSSADAFRTKAALDEAEALLRAYQNSPRGVQVEFIADMEGVKVLGADVSPYAQRVHAMAREHDNLTFVGCQYSVSMMNGRKGGPSIKLLPEVVVVPIAEEHIPARVNQGWAYIRI